jgi:L-alanine-DL-glutamate epimerase-like enolase superfamily enzyme
MYEAVLERFDGAILEDPHDRPDVAALIAPHAARVSFDAPIATARDVESAAFGARTVNVKPSRIGSLRALLDVYAHCERASIVMYGGGMGELGVARGQIELLASLFHPDAPNDVAPSAYNLPDLPAGLPESPLTPPARAVGFRWE